MDCYYLIRVVRIFFLFAIIDTIKNEITQKCNLKPI